VYGYKAPKAGEPEGELLPYYTYLAIRSALVNLRPDAVYLCVLLVCRERQSTTASDTLGAPPDRASCASQPLLV
jgi:hypothetical protein